MLFPLSTHLFSYWSIPLKCWFEGSYRTAGQGEDPAWDSVYISSETFAALTNKSPLLWLYVQLFLACSESKFIVNSHLRNGTTQAVLLSLTVSDSDPDSIRSVDPNPYPDSESEVSGCEFGSIRIRIRKLRNFMFRSAGCSLWGLKASPVAWKSFKEA